MTSSIQFSAAEQARRDYLRSLITSPGVENTLPAPTVPAVIPGDPEALLDATQILDSITVQIPGWGPNLSELNEQFTLVWSPADTPANEIQLDSRLIPPGPGGPLEINIPRHVYIQGPLLIKYRVVQFGFNTIHSLPASIKVDTIPPYGDRNPEDPGFVAEVITDEYLDNNDGKVIATIPDYVGREPGDIAFFWWVKDVPDDADQLPHTVGPIDMSGNREVVLTRDIFEQVGDGQGFGLYALLDRAGNISRLSNYVTANVALGPLPENLLPPLIPLANDGTVDRLDAFAGVVVQIPAFDGWKNGDLIHAQWGNTPLAVFPVGPAPVFPLSIHVPWTLLKQSYDFDADDSRQPVNVSYRVLRNRLPFPSDAPMAKGVFVDFKVAGPDNPNEPDPVNPTLKRPYVIGGSRIENKLNTDDFGKDATVYIKLSPAAVVGDELKVYWDGVVLLDSHVVGGSDIPGTTVVKFTVPWQRIEEHANNQQLPLHYTIADPQGLNYQQSDTTSVDVKVLTISFPAPTFPHLVVNDEGARALACSSIRKKGDEYGFYVHVAPDGKFLKAGVTVTMNWRVSDWPTGPSIAGTELSENVVITEEQELNGINWFVHSYDRCILPALEETSLKIGLSSMSFDVIAGGDLITSAYATEMIILVYGDGSCDLNNVP